MSTQHLSEQEIIRREKLEELKKMGIDAYPAALYPVNNSSVGIKENYKGEENKDQFTDVCLAGRIMSVRDMGKANFAVLQDAVGKIQFYIRQDDICPGEDKSLYQTVWKKLIDIGDIVGIKGYQCYPLLQNEDDGEINRSLFTSDKNLPQQSRGYEILRRYREYL